MREYEILFIIKPHLSQEKYQELTDKVTTIITENEGEVTLLNPMGMREIAHELKKCTQGYYVQCQFNAKPSLIEELRERIRLDENFLREMVVLRETIEPRKEVKEVAAA